MSPASELPTPSVLVFQQETTSLILRRCTNRETGSSRASLLFRLLSSAYFSGMKYSQLFDGCTASPVGGHPSSPRLDARGGQVDTCDRPCPPLMATGWSPAFPARMQLLCQRSPCGIHLWEWKDGAVVMETMLPWSINRAGLFPASLPPKCPAMKLCPTPASVLTRFAAASPAVQGQPGRRPSTVTALQLTSGDTDSHWTD